MAISSGYRDFIVEALGRVASITSKSMFGGVGLYADGYFVALIADDRLFFKVDDSNRPDFERAGMGPFRPYDDDRAMNYFEVPADVLEDVDELREWVEKAVDVAKNARKGKRGG